MGSGHWLLFTILTFKAFISYKNKDNNYNNIKSHEDKRTQCEATEGVSENPFPRAPPGLSRKGLGVNQHRKVLALSCAAPSTCTTLGFRENFNILPLNPLVAGDNHLGDAFAGNNLERLVG